MPDMLSKNRIKWLRSLQMKKHRTAEGVFVAEGPKLVGELLAGGFECVYQVQSTKYVAEGPQGATQPFPVELATEDELRQVSTVETPQGVLAVFRQPCYAVDFVKAAKANLCLALDEVQNPGNLGTIVRLADWFGIGDVFCSQGCADVFNPKTVQATMGALAHVRVHYIDLARVLERARQEGVTVYGTFLDGENIYEKRLANAGVIVMGNEGRGISAAVAQGVTERLTIPSWTDSHVESLNVAIATAVVCAEFRRQA